MTKYYTDTKTKVICVLIVNDKELTWLDHRPRKFIGIARCSSEDKFDFEVGKKLAYKRALRKMYIALAKEINIKDINMGLDRAFDDLKYYQKKKCKYDFYRYRIQELNKEIQEFYEV